jgi:hypothetical protein
MNNIVEFDTLQDWRKFRNENNDESHRSTDVESLALANVPSMETPMSDSADVQPASSEMRGGPGFCTNHTGQLYRRVKLSRD